MTKRRPKSEVLEPEKFDALLHRGVLKAQSGLYDEALQLFRAALRINPRSAEANLNLGNVLAETGRPEEALVSYDNALAMRPAFAEALYGRGNALQTLKRHEEALAAYDRVLVILPGRVEVLNNRGNTLHDLKRYEEALASYDRAIAIMPGAALLHNNRGTTLRELHRFEEAQASFAKALALEPDHVEALNNRGNSLRDLQRYEEAVASFDKALAIRPDHAVAHSNRGNALQDLKRHQEAIASYDKALAIRPDFAEALLGRGNALQELRRFEEAIANYDSALGIRPDLGDALYGRGNALQELGRYEEAAASYNKALEFRPTYVDALLNLGFVRAHQGRYAEMPQIYRKVLAIDPSNAEARTSYAHLCLARGDFDEGWTHYHRRPARLDALKMERVSDAALPDNLSGTSVLLLGEQGIGDELFFLRFATIFKQQGSRLFCRCNGKIRSLLKRTGLFDWVGEDDDPDPPSDGRLLIGDLPSILFHGSTFSFAPPLRLSALDERKVAMQERLGRCGTPPYIGLTWRAGTPLADQPFRGRLLYKEAPLNLLIRSLEGIPGTIIAIQRHPRDLELDALSKDLKRDVHDLSAANEDLEDMLALLALIDEYVGVSNTNMHLMAGIGRTARVLVPHPPDWRWMLRDGESPWFPGFSTYRQRPNGDWTSALARLTDYLARSLVR